MKAEIKEGSESRDRIFSIREHRWGSLERGMALPTAAVPDEMSAKLEKVTLTFTMPKAEEIKPKTITVKAG
jgi:HSP20 family protein